LQGEGFECPFLEISSGRERAITNVKSSISSVMGGVGMIRDNSSVMSITSGGDSIRPSVDMRKNRFNGMLEIKVKIMNNPQFKTNKKQVLSKAAAIIRQRMNLASDSIKSCEAKRDINLSSLLFDEKIIKVVTSVKEKNSKFFGAKKSFSSE